MIAGIIVAAIVLVAASVVLVRRSLIPPIEVERAADGLLLSVHRGAVSDVTVRANNGHATAIDHLPGGATLLLWSQLGVPDDAKQGVSQLTITGRSGHRHFETTISFGGSARAQYNSQTWRYVDPPDRAGDSERLTVVPDQP